MNLKLKRWGGVKAKKRVTNVSLVFFLFNLAALIIINFSTLRVNAASTIVKTYTNSYSALLTSGNSALRRPIIQVSVGRYHTCALGNNQQIYCSGPNGYGEIGNATAPDPTLSPLLFQLPTAGLTAKLVESDFSFETCAIASDQQVYCAGRNSEAELGNGLYTSSNTPVLFQLPGGKTALQVDHALHNTCALTNDHLVYCAGVDNFGILGNGPTSTDFPIPTQFQLGQAAQKMQTSNYVTCAVATADEQVYCAGYNIYGQLGIGNNTSQNLPVRFQLPAGKYAVDVAIGLSGYTVCVLTTDQQIYCAGQDANGVLGNSDGVVADQNLPVRFNLPAGKNVQSILLRDDKLCALTVDQMVYCAGRNDHGQLGDGSIGDKPVPVAFNLPAGKLAVQIAGFSISTCALTTDRQIYCVGDNYYGAFGNGTTSSTQSTPIRFKAPVGRTVQSLSAGENHVCALLTDLQLYCSGLSVDGRIGIGSAPTNISTPKQFLIP